MNRWSRPSSQPRPSSRLYMPRITTGAFFGLSSFTLTTSTILPPSGDHSAARTGPGAFTARGSPPSRAASMILGGPSVAEE